MYGTELAKLRTYRTISSPSAAQTSCIGTESNFFTHASIFLPHLAASDRTRAHTQAPSSKPPLDHLLQCLYRLLAHSRRHLAHLARISVVRPDWRYTTYSTSHFHSKTHELLATANGSGRMFFGGDGNPYRFETEVHKDDSTLILASIAHKLLEDRERGFKRGVNRNSPALMNVPMRDCKERKVDPSNRNPMDKMARRPLSAHGGTRHALASMRRVLINPQFPAPQWIENNGPSFMVILSDVSITRKLISVPVPTVDSEACLPRTCIRAARATRHQIPASSRLIQTRNKTIVQRVTELFFITPVHGPSLFLKHPQIAVGHLAGLGAALGSGAGVYPAPQLQHVVTYPAHRHCTTAPGHCRNAPGAAAVSCGHQSNAAIHASAAAARDAPTAASECSKPGAARHPRITVRQGPPPSQPHTMQCAPSPPHTHQTPRIPHLAANPLQRKCVHFCGQNGLVRQVGVQQ
ncbi:hypothetical protein CERSUDRAFT_126149 [Gelatoporia subvermispora B]|uniref:Uncharacterized protein n=1 Tax=Ceriporiopsis subvermispora (strain B) TaxID=914234 RepID=M2QMM2_CERS8|nr:hypothetical protein CERSUDRAFT_126149 [Gelatoporia subvermispora B]